MSRSATVVLVALSCAGCGRGIDGTWRLSSTATLQTGATETIVEDFIILPPPLAWKAGGGCEAPLSETNQVAQLASANWTCPLKSQAGLPFPFDGHSSYTWKDGDVLLVKNAVFSEGSDGQLAIVVSLQIRSDPANPDLGDTLDIMTQPGHGAVRVK